MSIAISLHSPHLHERHFKRINHLLLIILVLLSAYIMFIPFVPEVTAFYNKQTDKTRGFKYESRLAIQEAERLGISREYLKPIPNENRLVMPQIGVDSLVVEGIGPDVLDKGLWRRPNSSTPDKGGNTVITGHRFLYSSGPKTFYNLDKVQIGDKFFLFWEGVEYDYEVVDIFVVEPDQIEIEDNTPEPLLTLYTCTPLWSSAQRLVIRARLIN
ncbi:MAG TPA: sortase [Candidatus Woesebacteria bacterium]|nr:sortase [Candidatus Woesebacteria bacterium]HNS94879.1 sortase [Candidatus Woesebacteria bacterium]